MKRNFTFFLLLFCFSGFGQQENSISQNKFTWKKAARFSLIVGQAGGKNWASGSDVFSISVNSFLDVYANGQNDKWYFNNSLIASYGFINSDEYATIKNDDKIDFFSTAGAYLKNRPELGIGAAFNFRSQFSNGYDRDYLNQGLKRRTSGFFAPAYITIAPVGVSYNKRNIDVYATTFGFRGVVVSNAPYSYLFQGGIIPGDIINDKNPANTERSLATMYGVDPKKDILVQAGPYISVGYNKEIFKNVIYSGRLDAFSDFIHSKPGNIDVFWTNTFYLKVNKWLNAVYSLDLAYDDDIKKFGYFKDHPALQAKSILGVGISTRFGKKKDKTHKRMDDKMHN
ncbi:MAG: DUF3078 domain-containing protein [Ginsengibacter sp.]